MTARQAQDLIERLPPVRGRLTAQAPLAPVTWFRVGGAAEVMFRPADAEDLAEFLAKRPPEVPVTVIGVASNLLVRDGGVEGVVVRLGRGFAAVEISGARVTASAGVLDLNVAITARAAGVGGLEFLSGIPGSIGGALRMNAGAYGREIKDVLESAAALDNAGVRHELSLGEMGLGYRHCGVPEDWIFLGVTLRGQEADRDAIQRRMAEIQSEREASQPIRARTGGSTFANPPGRKAWELIDAAGCRGLKRGGAMVSPMHANFLVNTGDATAADLEVLGEDVRRRVLAASGIALAWEIRRIGEPAGDEP